MLAQRPSTVRLRQAGIIRQLSALHLYQHFIGGASLSGNAVTSACMHAYKIGCPSASCRHIGRSQPAVLCNSDWHPDQQA